METMERHIATAKKLLSILQEEAGSQSEAHEIVHLLRHFIDLASFQGQQAAGPCSGEVVSGHHSTVVQYGPRVPASVE